jgi:hypothetical protein
LFLLQVFPATPQPETRGNGLPIAAIAGGVAGGVSLLALFGVCVALNFFRKRNSKNVHNEPDPGMLLDSALGDPQNTSKTPDRNLGPGHISSKPDKILFSRSPVESAPDRNAADLVFLNPDAISPVEQRNREATALRPSVNNLSPVESVTGNEIEERAENLAAVKAGDNQTGTRSILLARADLVFLDPEGETPKKIFGPKRNGHEWAVPVDLDVRCNTDVASTECKSVGPVPGEIEGKEKEPTTLTVDSVCQNVEIDTDGPVLATTRLNEQDGFSGIVQAMTGNIAQVWNNLFPQRQGAV